MAVRLMRQPEVSAITTLPRSSLYRAISEGRFPAPVQVSPRRVAWDSDQVTSWLDSNRRNPKNC